MGNASVEAYKRLLKRIPARAATAGRAALIDTAEKMTGMMKALVRKDTGKLAGTIKYEVAGDGLSVTIQAGGKETEKPVRSGANVMRDYGLYQEFGTKDVPAQPFFWPAYRANKKKARAKVKRDLKKAIIAEGGK